MPPRRRTERGGSACNATIASGITRSKSRTYPSAARAFWRTWIFLAGERALREARRRRREPGWRATHLVPP
jgi:hypothetical protein